ncbi:MAG: YbhB/YbcL family Raf kinase inhibitor-like protein [Acidimicrobiales bacterium]|jgi:Raf kinase inhibitor-like YbhB/YbcL family protein
MTLTLSSPDFEDGKPIPSRFDHASGDVSPALHWQGVPDGTAELVLLMIDPDARTKGGFVHWVLYGLDPARTGLKEGETPAEASPGAQGYGQPGYLGPAPPVGDAPHHYTFRLLALDEKLVLENLPTYKEVDAATAGRVLAEARLVGTYQRI